MDSRGVILREGDILATRFFAPKIVDISQTPLKIGWRKLVRLRSRPDSAAARVGVEAATILFNFFALAGQDSFLNQLRIIFVMSNKYIRAI